MSSYETNVYISDQRKRDIEKEIRDTSNYVASCRDRLENLRVTLIEKQEELERMQKLNEARIHNAMNSLSVMHTDNIRMLAEQSGEQVSELSEDMESNLALLRTAVANSQARADEVAKLTRKIAEDVNAVFERVAGREKNTKKRAEFVFNEIKSMLAEIENLNPEMFLPREYFALSSIFESAKNNISSGDYSAAIIVSQTGVIDAVNLLTRLSVMNEQYNIKLSEANEMAADLEQRFAAFDSESVGKIIVSNEGQQNEYDYDISFWSEGQYGKIKDSFLQIRKDLEAAENMNMSMENLDATTQNISVLTRQLDECDRVSREALISSENVFNMAEVFHDQVNSLGWSLQDSGFEEDDDRKPYTMRYVGPTGSEMAVVIATGKDADKPNISFDVYGDNEISSKIIKDGIMSGLQESGAELSSSVVKDDCGSNSNPQEFIDNTVRNIIRTEPNHVDRLKR